MIGDRGEYDNQGYRLRTASMRFETLMPGLYPGRTRHIQVKVPTPNRPILTT